MPLSAVPRRPWDAIVIGAGPAGATAALRLAGLGHRVLLIDQGYFPREKVCGDGLITDALDCLGRMGLRKRVESLGHHSAIARIFSRSRIEYELSLHPFISLKRERLDLLVVERAVQSGVTFAQGAISDVRQNSDGSIACSTSAGDKSPTARFVIMATGANSPLPHRVGMGQTPRPTHIAVRCYVRSPFSIPFPVISYDKSILPGCAWIFPLGAGEYNVGFCVRSQDRTRGHTSVKKAFKAFLSEFPLARQLMNRTDSVTPLRGSLLRTSLKGATPHLESRPLLAIGAAIGTTLPLSGEGIGKAMESGELAADVVHDVLCSGTLAPAQRYSEMLRARTKPRYASYEAAERWLARPWLNDLIAIVLKRNERLRGALAGVLHETADPQAVFSVRGLLRLL